MDLSSSLSSSRLHNCALLVVRPKDFSVLIMEWRSKARGGSIRMKTGVGQVQSAFVATTTLKMGSD